jgi:cytochrome c oxidase subunit 2
VLRSNHAQLKGWFAGLSSCAFSRSPQKSYKFAKAAAAILLCATLFIHSSASQMQPRRVDVVARRFAFEPSDITLKRGQPVDLVLKSTDVAHGLRFHELNVDIKVKKGETTQVSFTPDRVGSFVGHCSVFCGSGHGQMVLTIRVVE